MEQSTILRTDKVLTNKELLTYYLNMFSDKVIANLIDFAHYERVQQEDPKYATTDQMGRPVTVDTLVAGHRKGARLARRNVEYIKEMLEREENGTLGELWDDSRLGAILSPLDLSKKEEE